MNTLVIVLIAAVPIAKTKASIAAISAADLNFRVTTLLAGKPAARPLPEWIGERTLLTVGDRLRLLGVRAFHRGCSQGMACPFLAGKLRSAADIAAILAFVFAMGFRCGKSAAEAGLFFLLPALAKNTVF